MTSLTDRYVSATLRHIPARQRTEIERELRAAIADATESQTETDALTALGDPARLAADYADRPLYLVGPSLYSDYTRTLVVVLVSVLAPLLVASGIAHVVGGEGFGAALLASANLCGLVAMHIAIWTTVVFAVVERAPGRRDVRAPTWTPASLEQLPEKRIDLGSIIGGSAMVAVIASALILVEALGPVGIIEPTLWNSGALLLVVAFAAASIALDVVGYYVGWSMLMATANAALSALFVACGVGLAVTDRLLNPAFFAAVGWPAGAGPNGLVTWIIIGLIVLMSISNVAIGFAKARGGVKHA